MRNRLSWPHALVLVAFVSCSLNAFVGSSALKRIASWSVSLGSWNAPDEQQEGAASKAVEANLAIIINRPAPMFEWRSLGTLNDHAEAELSTRIGEPMLLTTASSRMLDFLISWVANVRIAMPEQLVVVGALDQATFDWCSRAKVPALLVATTHNGTSSSYLRINAWLFASMAIAKVSLLVAALRTGSDVFLSDVDVVWLQSPWHWGGPAQYRLLSLVDVATMTDAMNVATAETDDALQMQLANAELNTGLMFVRATSAGKAVAAAWLKALRAQLDLARRTAPTGSSTPPGLTHDQKVFNTQILERHASPTSLKRSLNVSEGVWDVFNYTRGLDETYPVFTVLPPRLFQNGHVHFVQHLWPKHEAVAVHVTHSFDKLDGKRNRMRSAGLWRAENAAEVASSTAAPIYLQLLAPTLPSLADAANTPSARPTDWRTLVETDPAGLCPRRWTPEDPCTRYAFALARYAAHGRRMPGQWEPERHAVADKTQRQSVYLSMMLAFLLNATALVLPRLQCYCERTWWVTEQCTFAGLNTRMPFDCPIDLLYEPSRWRQIEEKTGLSVLQVEPEGSLAAISRLPRHRLAAPSISNQSWTLRDAVSQARSAISTSAGLVIEVSADELLTRLCVCEAPPDVQRRAVWSVENSIDFCPYERQPALWFGAERWNRTAQPLNCTRTGFGDRRPARAMRACAMCALEEVPAAKTAPYQLLNFADARKIASHALPCRQSISLSTRQQRLRSPRCPSPPTLTYRSRCRTFTCRCRTSTCRSPLRQRLHRNRLRRCITAIQAGPRARLAALGGS